MNDLTDNFGRTIHQAQVTLEDGSVIVRATSSDGSIQIEIPIADYSEDKVLRSCNAMGPHAVQYIMPQSAVVQPVQFTKADGSPVPTTPDGRLDVRVTTAKRTTNFNLRVLSFYTSTALVHNVNPATDASFNDTTVKMYSGNNSGYALTDDSAQCTKTVIDWVPHYNYEVIGGYADIPPSIKGGTTDLWYMSVVGVPDYPTSFGGSTPYISEVNLEAVMTQKVVSDGRAISYLAYNYGGAPGTNKLRFIIKHPAGASERFQLYIEHFV